MQKSVVAVELRERQYKFQSSLRIQNYSRSEYCSRSNVLHSIGTVDTTSVDECRQDLFDPSISGADSLCENCARVAICFCGTGGNRRERSAAFFYANSAQYFRLVTIRPKVLNVDFSRRIIQLHQLTCAERYSFHRNTARPKFRPLRVYLHDRSKADSLVHVTRDKAKRSRKH